MTLLLIVYGAPGCGKSTLATELQKVFIAKSWDVENICFDKRYREEASHLGLSDLHSEASRPVWLQSRLKSFETVSALLTTYDATDRQRMVVVDDTLHLRSMRRAFYQLARDAGAGLLLIQVAAPMGVAADRNLARPPTEQVPEPSFSRVHRHLQSTDRPEPWQSSRTLLVHGDGDLEEQVSDAVAFIQKHAVSSRIVVDTVDADTKERAQRVTQASLVHQVDIALRQLISAAMSSPCTSYEEESKVNLKAHKASRVKQLKGFRDQVLSVVRATSAEAWALGHDDSSACSDIQTAVAFAERLFKSKLEGSKPHGT